MEELSYSCLVPTRPFNTASSLVSPLPRQSWFPVCFPARAVSPSTVLLVLSHHQILMGKTEDLVANIWGHVLGTVSGWDCVIV